MVYHENIEKIFMDEVREKKRTGSGSFHKRGKGVKHGMNGAFRTPYYFMSNKEKKNLSGKCEVYNMYETILSREEFALKDKETQRNMMIRWREIYSNDVIMSTMGINSAGAFHNVIKELDVPKKKKWDRTGGDLKEKAPKPKKEKASKSVAINSQLELVPEETEVKPILISRGLHLEYNGEYDSEQINRIFTKLQLLTEGEENKFSLSISLSERT